MVLRALETLADGIAVNGHGNGNGTSVCVVADSVANKTSSAKSAVLHRHLDHEFLKLESGEGGYLITAGGQRILDASGGAAVACLGWGNKRVTDAVTRQLAGIPYCATTFYTTDVYEELCRTLVESTNGHMARAYIVSSGSEAMEAALKLARQYFLEKDTPEPQRTRYISRRQSYHGITLGALSVGGHELRRRYFEPLLMGNVSRVSPCFAYRGKGVLETEEQYVARLAGELDDEFQRVGPDTVCAFIAEPVVGAALGCVSSVPGYFKAIQAVCQKYGALLIFDEVMCGMGRTGTLHAWQQEDIAPDIQTIGKCLGGGYQPVAGVLASHKVIDALAHGTSVFVHGHTYQGHPAACAAALEVQRIIREEGLVENARVMGGLLSKLLSQTLGDHPNVGDIRGRGLFWGIEFVADKATAAPFPSERHVAMGVSEQGLTRDYSISVYPGTGSAEDGIRGDHVIIAPPFNVTEEDVKLIVAIVGRLVTDFFARLDEA